MFRFANSYILYALFLLPLAILVYVFFVKQYHKAIKRFGNPELLETLMPNRSLPMRHFKFLVYLVALAFLIIAAARPQFGSKLQEMKREGIEIILALDVSNSMRAEDIKPSRLERAKQAILTLLGKLDSDRIGLIVFAGDAYTQIPLTNDYASARMFLANTTTDMVSKQGTAIGSAIELGMKSFSPNDEASKVIVIISDGENHEGDAMAKAREAAEKGISVYTIGMGSADGAPIPDLHGNGFIKDRQGQVVMSKMNAKMLSQIAAEGNGKYYTASTSNVGLNKLYSELNDMQKAELETHVYSEYDDQYQYFVFAAFILLLLEFIVSEKKSKLSESLNIFKSK